MNLSNSFTFGDEWSHKYGHIFKAISKNWLWFSLSCLERRIIFLLQHWSQKSVPALNECIVKQIREFSTHFTKIPKYENSWKSADWDSLFPRRQADGYSWLKYSTFPVCLTFVITCIVSVITADNSQHATILIYLLQISSTCFGWCFRPASGTYHCNYSFCCFPPKLLLAGVAYWVEVT